MSCSAHAARGDRPVWTRRRVLRESVAVAGIGILAACGCAPSVTQRPKVPTVGFVSPQATDLEQFLGPFRALGYVDGQSVTIASRTQVLVEAADALRPEVEDLVRLPVDVLVALGSTTAGLAKVATRTIPVVFFGVADAIVLGLVTSLARPEGNVTGLTNVSGKAIGKGLEYLLQLVPGVAHVAFVGNLEGNPGSQIQLAHAKAAAGTMGVGIIEFALRDASGADIDSVFASFSKSGVKAIMVGSDAVTFPNRQHLADAAAQYRLPTIYPRRESVVAGGLIAYGPSYPALFKRLAALVDKIVRGVAPGDIPVEEPKDFDLVPNLKTAQALGITIPQAILAQATEVIR